MKRSVSAFLLFINIALLIISCWCPVCSVISALLAIIVAYMELHSSTKMEKKLAEYDKFFQTKYNSNGDIEEMVYDSGTY